uniref:hypothetical protein n=1 Tax=Burkholderia sp. M701 TaxID=326454 RepID=UPI00159EDA5E|nr:hypothetical protein [Burkholderia sp. M701]
MPDMDLDLEQALELATTLGRSADLALDATETEGLAARYVSAPASQLTEARDTIISLVRSVKAARAHANPVKPDVDLVSQLLYIALGSDHESDKEILRAAAARVQYGIPDIEITDEMVRAGLAVQWPALYRDALYTEGDGPSLRRDTETRIDIVKRQFAAMIRVMLKPAKAHADD